MLQYEEKKQILMDFILLSMNKVIKPYEESNSCPLGYRQLFALEVLTISGPVTMTDFSDRVNIKKQQATKLVNRLVERGFVERLYDKNDRRTIKIIITPEGRDFLANNNTRSVDGLMEIISDMEDESAFYESLKKTNEFISKLPKYEGPELDEMLG
ncbi:MAG: MarR family transcriptional regulator [Firmicutes bacterium]|nr:MarR family transcriptional regulator [Bacillota bacterium]